MINGLFLTVCWWNNDFDFGDGCWRQNVLVTSLICWWLIWYVGDRLNKLKKYQHNDKSRQHNDSVRSNRQFIGILLNRKIEKSFILNLANTKEPFYQVFFHLRSKSCLIWPLIMRIVPIISSSFSINEQ